MTRKRLVAVRTSFVSAEPGFREQETGNKTGWNCDTEKDKLFGSEIEVFAYWEGDMCMFEFQNDTYLLEILALWELLGNIYFINLLHHSLNKAVNSMDLL